MPWKPQYPGERPTLGHYVLDWIEENLAAPDRQEYEPFVPTREQAEFILRFYEVDVTGRRRIIRRGVLSRPRGWGKSPFLASLCLVEGLADVVPDGFDADGRPAGRPWSTVRTPLVQLAAVSEEQVRKNTWAPMLEMVDPSLWPPVFDNYPGIEPMETFVNLPKGQISFMTASGSTAKGNRPIFQVWDQTEEWFPGNGGTRLARILADNAAKVGSPYIETPNAYTPGMQSVAEATANAWRAIQEGRARVDRGLLYDHREAPPDTSLTDLESLTAGLRYAYGDSSDHPGGCVIHEPACEPGWSPIDSHIARIWDPDADEQGSRGNFLNQITHASDSWLSEPEWKACRDTGRSVKRSDPITLGFDGSRGRAKGKPDATALVACRVSDGHVWPVDVWEAPDSPSEWEAWEPPLSLIEETIDRVFREHTVVGFYCDPARDWRSYVNAWEAKYGGRVKVRESVAHPFEWWMTGGRSIKIERAVQQLEAAVRNRDMTHAGDPRLTRHVLNARRRLAHNHLTLGKESSYSSRKIDAAIAAVLAWQARLDALAAGAGLQAKTSTKFGRIY